MKYKLYNQLFIIISFLFLPFIASSQWSSAIAFPGAERDGAIGFSINGKGYIAGGLFSFDTWEYNPSSNSWLQKANINGNQTVLFAASFVFDNKAYMVCGDTSFGTSINSVIVFDPLLNKWKAKSDFPGGNRVGLAAWVAEGRVFVGGGTDYLDGSGVGPCHNDFYEYFPETDTWVNKGTLPVNIAFPSCFVIDDKCYFTFGMKNNSTHSKELWAYDPLTNTWTKKASNPGTARSLGVGFSINGRGYAGLGQSNFSTMYNSIYEYNPTTDLWINAPNYPNSYSAGSISFVINDTAYVGTGADLVNFIFGTSIYRFTSETTSIEEQNDFATINISPNPTYGILRIAVSDPSSINEIEVYSQVGQKLFNQRVLQGENEIDLQEFESGLYFLKLKGSKGEYIRKLVKL